MPTDVNKDEVGRAEVLLVARVCMLAVEVVGATGSWTVWLRAHTNQHLREMRLGPWLYVQVGGRADYVGREVC